MTQKTRLRQRRDGTVALPLIEPGVDLAGPIHHPAAPHPAGHPVESRPMPGVPHPFESTQRDTELLGKLPRRKQSVVMVVHGVNLSVGDRKSNHLPLLSGSALICGRVANRWGAGPKVR